MNTEMNMILNIKKFVLAVAAIAFLTSVPAFAQEMAVPPVPPPGNVTLPLEEYNHLLELANKSPKHVESAPLPYTIKRGDVKLRVTPDTVMGTVQLQGETFNKSETKVALTSGMTCQSASPHSAHMRFTRGPTSPDNCSSVR